MAAEVAFFDLLGFGLGSGLVPSVVSVDFFLDVLFAGAFGLAVDFRPESRELVEDCGTGIIRGGTVGCVLAENTELAGGSFSGVSFTDPLAMLLFKDLKPCFVIVLSVLAQVVDEEPVTLLTN